MINVSRLQIPAVTEGRPRQICEPSQLKFRKINKKEIMANEYENSSGIILCFKSYTVIRTRRDIMTIEIATETVKIRGEVSKVLAFFKYTNINKMAVNISTRTY